MQYIHKFRPPRIRQLLGVMLILILVVSDATAGLFIKGFDGAKEQYQLVRDGQPVPFMALTALKQGDVIHIKSDGGEVYLVQGDNSQVLIGKSDSPYTVKEKQPDGLFERLSKVALEWYQGDDDGDANAVSMITRGEGFTIQGMDPDENLVARGGEKLTFYWLGGEPPFSATLLSIDGDVLVSASTDKQRVTLPLGNLQLGDYIFAVNSKGASGSVGDEREFSLVDAAQLPVERDALEGEGLPASVGHSLAAIELSANPEWHFSALQRALQGGDQQLIQALLDGRYPESD